MNWLCHDNKSDRSLATFLFRLDFHTQHDCIRRNKLNSYVYKHGEEWDSKREHYRGHEFI
jgi:hypothetical protein